jgi:hypothetical protein
MHQKFSFLFFTLFLERKHHMKSLLSLFVSLVICGPLFGQIPPPPPPDIPFEDRVTMDPLKIFSWHKVYDGSTDVTSSRYDYRAGEEINFVWQCQVKFELNNYPHPAGSGKIEYEMRVFGLDTNNVWNHIDTLAHTQTLTIGTTTLTLTCIEVSASYEEYYYTVTADLYKNDNGNFTFIESMSTGSYPFVTTTIVKE